jgi:DNA repair photolyase
VEKVQLLQLIDKDNTIQFNTLEFPDNIFDLDKSTEFGLNLVSLDEDVRREYEPNSSSYLERISCLKDLHDYGFKTFINMDLHPKIILKNNNLKKLLKIISFVDKIFIKKSSSHIDPIILNDYHNIIINYCNENYIMYFIFD